MKTIILLCITTCGMFYNAKSQTSLSNTAWQGQAKIPEENTIILYFKTDTVYMYMLPEMVIGETMVYTTKGNTLTWRKTSGNSPCDTVATGTYEFITKGDELMLNLIKEACPARESAWMNKPFKKVAAPVK